MSFVAPSAIAENGDKFGIKVMHFIHLPLAAYRDDPERDNKPCWCIAVQLDDGRIEHLTRPDLIDLTREEAEAKALEMNGRRQAEMDELQASAWRISNVPPRS